jgi:hypothetical protein
MIQYVQALTLAGIEITALLTWLGAKVSFDCKIGYAEFISWGFSIESVLTIVAPESPIVQFLRRVAPTGSGIACQPTSGQPGAAGFSF